jgi:hypothetical protein
MFLEQIVKGTRWGKEIEDGKCRNRHPLGERNVTARAMAIYI